MTGKNGERNRGANRWSSRETACSSGKWSYPVRAEAKRHSSRINRMRGDNLRPYRCPECGLWHVGHKPRAVIEGVMTANERYGRESDPVDVRGVVGRQEGDGGRDEEHHEPGDG